MQVTLTFSKAGAAAARIVNLPRFLLEHSLTRRLLLLQVASCMLMLVTLFSVFWHLATRQATQETKLAISQLGNVLIDLPDPAVTAPRLVQRLAESLGEQGSIDDELRYEMRDASGMVLVSSPTRPHPLPEGWFSSDFHDADSGRSIVVAINGVMAREVWREDMMHLMSRVALVTAVLIVPIAVLASALLTRFGLAPMRELSRTIALRSPDNLAPVAASRRYSELTPLLDELNRLLDNLRNARSGERRFFADAAHELLTPVTALRAQTHLLATAPDLAAKVSAHDHLDGGLQRITTLIRQLLLVARLGSNELQLTLVPQDLLPLMQERLSLVAARAMDKGVDLALQAPRACVCAYDRDMFATVLDNLFDNAIRYVPAGGQIKVSVRRSARSVWIAVADDGPGIPVELRHKVFERFFRVPGTSETGSGLGLSIVARTVALHEGVVTFRDGLRGRGVTAFVRLPAPVT